MTPPKKNKLPAITSGRRCPCRKVISFGRWCLRCRGGPAPLLGTVAGPTSGAGFAPRALRGEAAFYLYSRITVKEVGDGSC